MYQINAIGSTIAKSSNFTTNSVIYGIGVSGGNSPYGLFYAPERLALPWDKVIGKRQHHLFWSGIFTYRFSELLVDRRPLNYVNCSPALHHVGYLQRIQVIHYVNHGEFVSLALLPVN